MTKQFEDYTFIDITAQLDRWVEAEEIYNHKRASVLITKKDLGWIAVAIVSEEKEEDNES